MLFIQCDRMTRRAHRQRYGVTLMELMVTIVILGVVLGITTLSLAGERTPTGTVLSIASRVRALRSKAITSGVSQTAVLSDTMGALLVTALPDGRVISDMPNLDRNEGVVLDIKGK